MTRSVARRRSAGIRGRELPRIVWLMAGAGVWLAAVGATGALLTVGGRADGAAGAGRDVRGARRRGPPKSDAGGLAELRLGAIAVDVREPQLAARIGAIAAGGPDRRRQRGPQGR